VRITLSDGRRLARREPVSRGTPERPLSAADVEAKFVKNASRVLPESEAKRLVDMVGELERLPSIGTLVRECVVRD